MIAPHRSGLHRPIVHRTMIALVLLLGSMLGGCGAEVPGDGAVVSTGERVYQRYCFSCHAAGVAGAPKVGVAEQWQARAAKGEALLLASTIAGIPPGMPPRGLCNSCSDEELQAAIAFMLAASEVAYPKPAAPENVPSGDAGTVAP